ncbi:hypothetical protein SAMN04487895_106191 [Paenibacillus sophorae]|uniref:Uncharacterized protein n=1 Tax=Paenibacillus sophorae TaxID=1333845 RepID=A0A1H8NE66_9BACL|nr:hypothetical protein [Paenibacillus sophorae]QWU14660.1 hypothetical protein KP014_22450 [Paenibacillus sophorae]SEO27895.1 hypothetical protein SAMN04487895_106191 [Paenibacillus sophorae]
MKTSSFFYGVMLGAAASMFMSKKRNMFTPMLGQSGAAEKAKNKIINMATAGFGSTSANQQPSQTESLGSEGHKGASPVRSKEANLSMLKDFIRSNPEVKHDVEKILKETHTAIPGL